MATSTLQRYATKAELDNLTETETYSYSAYGFNFYRVGRICMFNYSFAIAVAAWGAKNLFTLPAAFWPAIHFKTLSANDFGYDVLVEISTSGAVNCVNRAYALDTNNWNNGGGCYVCAGD